MTSDKNSNGFFEYFVAWPKVWCLFFPFTTVLFYIENDMRHYQTNQNYYYLPENEENKKKEKTKGNIQRNYDFWTKLKMSIVSL